MHRTMNLLEQLTHVRKAGLSPSGFHVLLCLSEYAPMNSTEIADHTHTSKANITGILKRLERDKWVERLIKPNDRRQWLILPSEKAFKLLENAPADLPATVDADSRKDVIAG